MRAAPRLAPRHSATAAVYAGREQLAYGVLTNVSQTGACIVTDSLFAAGADVNLKLSFYQQPELIETPARVVWNRVGADTEGHLQGLQLYGVRFTQTPEPEAHRLSQLLGTEAFVTVYDPAADASASAPAYASEFERLQSALESDLDRLAERLTDSVGGELKQVD